MCIWRMRIYDILDGRSIFMRRTDVEYVSARARIERAWYFIGAQTFNGRSAKFLEKMRKN